MKTIVIIAAVLSLAGLSGCATRSPVPASPESPAATGETKVSKDKNGNTVVQLKVQHVAPPQNLQPPKAVYVVWLETPENERQNFGELKVGNDREGKISGITTFRVFRLFITAEDFPTVTQPSSQEILRTGLLEAK